MAIKNKVHFSVYLSPENVSFLREAWGWGWRSDGGLSGLLDAFLSQTVRFVKMCGKNKYGEYRILARHVKEMVHIKETV